MPQFVQVRRKWTQSQPKIKGLYRWQYMQAKQKASETRHSHYFRYNLVRSFDFQCTFKHKLLSQQDISITANLWTQKFVIIPHPVDMQDCRTLQCNFFILEGSLQCAPSVGYISALLTMNLDTAHKQQQMWISRDWQATLFLYHNFFSSDLAVANFTCYKNLYE